jgi:hypothetical protein
VKREALHSVDETLPERASDCDALQDQLPSVCESSSSLPPTQVKTVFDLRCLPKYKLSSILLHRLWQLAFLVEDHADVTSDVEVLQTCDMLI